MKSVFLTSLFALSLHIGFAQSGLDKRALRHYSEAELESILKDPARLAKTNYLFSSSFQFVPSDSAQAAPIDPSSIDIWEYDFHRYQDKPRTIFISRMHDKIILQSRNDLEKAYKEIESSNQ